MPVDTSGPHRADIRVTSRWTGACAALAALALLAAGCGSGSGGTNGKGSGSMQGGRSEYGTSLYGTLPPTGTPVNGGTISFAQLSGETATDIFPMTDGANCTTADFEINGAMYLPLYNGPSGAVPKVDYALSVGRPPSFSDGDRTVTIPLRQGLKWSGGAPVDANDVLFYIALLKAAIKESAASWCQYTPGEFPTSVTSMSAPNSHTVVLHLDKPFNPGFFVNNNLQDTDGGIYPMPSTDWNIDRAGGPHLSDWRNPAVAKRIYDYLNKAGTTLSTWNSNPLWTDVDGAFHMKDFSVTNGTYELVPNPSVGLGPKPRFSKLEMQTYTSETAALTALKTGAVDVIPLDPSQLGAVAALRSQGVSVFGGPNFGWNAGIVNFKDTTDDFNHVIAQLYVRQALEHLIDEPAMIKGIFKNAASATYGPVPSAPSSPYAPANATTPPYPYNPTAAAALLRAHGWKVVPNGQTTCAKPGTGAGECGSGIPKGTPIKFVWASPPQAEAADLGLLADTVASAAKRVGIDIVLSTKSEEFLSDSYNDSDPGDAKYTNDWGVLEIGALLNDYYPTQDGYDSPGALDIGGYDDPTANRDIAASVHSGDVHAVEREAAYITRDLPGLYLPNPDVLFAVSKDIGGPPDSWTALTEGSAFFPQYWYRAK